MRRGGFLQIVCAFAGHAIRGFGVRVSQSCSDLANAIDPRVPEQIEPAREWDLRLWQRDHDDRTENEERRP